MKKCHRLFSYCWHYKEIKLLLLLLIIIKIEGPVIEEFKVAPAIGLWKSKRGEFCAVFCSVETLYVDFQALNFIVQRDM